MEKESMLAAMMFGGGGGGLPDAAAASEGDVLSLNGNKEPVWAPPSGGESGVVYNIPLSSSAIYDLTYPSSYVTLTGYTFTGKNIRDNFESGISFDMTGSTIPSSKKEADSNVKGGGGGEDEIYYDISLKNVRLTGKKLTDNVSQGSQTLVYTSEVVYVGAYRFYLNILINPSTDYISQIRLLRWS